MKRAFAISMCIFILLQSGILTFQYVLKLSHHKRAIEDQLASGMLTERLLNFTSAELSAAKWENDHEFFLGGQKYDVVKVASANGDAIYSCINDKVEKQLINGLEKSEKKAGLIEELLKKINFQLTPCSEFACVCNEPVNAPHSVFISPDYDFCFLRLINKPPIS